MIRIYLYRFLFFLKNIFTKKDKQENNDSLFREMNEIIPELIPELLHKYANENYMLAIEQFRPSKEEMERNRLIKCLVEKYAESEDVEEDYEEW